MKIEIKYPTSKCEYCGKTYTKKHGNQKYCSPECARNRKREQTAISRMKYYYRNKKRGGDKIWGLGTGGLGAHKHDDDNLEKQKIDNELHRLKIKEKNYFLQ